MSSLALQSLEDKPAHLVRTINARRGGGRESVFVPILRGVVSGLPRSLEGLILTSDLQGLAKNHAGDLEPSGVAIAAELERLVDLKRFGVVLAGDLYSVPDASKRGGFGDVASVWRAFLERSAWVAGVAGNHDDVSTLPSDARLLDSETTRLDGMKIGGVGLICGAPERLGRRAEADQLAAIELVSDERPDILVLHEGPPGGEGQPGNDRIERNAPFIVCGHVHWERPVHRDARGVIINVDARVIVLSRSTDR